MHTCKCFACRFLVFVSLVVGHNAGWAEDPKTISVISYNVQFLPPPASFANKRPEPDYRAMRIAEEVARHDVVALQDTFHAKHRGQIISGVERAWDVKAKILVAPQPEGFATNGGCLLLTRLSMPIVTSRVYKHFSKPEEYGLRADGFAAKGVIHGCLVPDEQQPSEMIDVYVTHLEARADHLRPQQYLELATFIKQTSDPARPLIVVGDLNTNGLKANRDNPNSQYTQLMKEFNKARPSGMTDVWVALRGEEYGGTSDQDSTETGKRIDYIFISNPDQPGRRLVATSIEVKTFQDEKVIALSDHNAVVAVFEWR